MENEMMALKAWNFSITNQMKALLYVRTNNGIIPTNEVNARVNKAMEILEGFEELKQGIILAQLSKHALLCKKEAESISAWQFWKRDRLKLLWISYSVYQNSMAIILDTLPTDIEVLMQERQSQSSTEQTSPAPSSPETPHLKVTE